MSSQRRVAASRANGAKSQGPITPEGKKRSSQNALNHGLFADLILLKGEDSEALEGLLEEHLARFQPVGDVEEAIVHQICAAQWRLYRILNMETQALNKQLATRPAGPNPFFLADAFMAVAASTATALMQRYETRMQLIHQRALRSFKLLRSIDPPSSDNAPSETAKNEPSPITGQPDPAPPDPQPTDSEAVVTVRSSLPTAAATPSASPAPAKTQASPETSATLPWEGSKEPGGGLSAA